MENIAYIYQPHFKTKMFRVAMNKQQSPNYNYIVVTCSPQYNGVWRYDGEIHAALSKWVNGSTICYEVPIDKCEFIKSLFEVTDEKVRNNIIKQQSDWLHNTVKNRNYRYTEKPEWFID